MPYQWGKNLGGGVAPMHFKRNAFWQPNTPKTLFDGPPQSPIVGQTPQGWSSHYAPRPAKSASSSSFDPSSFFAPSAPAPAAPQTDFKGLAELFKNLNGPPMDTAKPKANSYTVPIPRNNPISPEVAAAARQGVQDTVHNPAEQMYHASPGLKQLSTPSDFNANMGLGERFKKLAQQRNLQNMDVTLSTQPIESQLDRSMVAAQAGLGQAELLRNMQQQRDQYGLAQHGQKVNAAKIIFGR